LKQVKGFTKEGDIQLANGWLLPREYGNLTHGYCITSYSSQSKGVDCVFLAESSESFRAADREQFYVSVSRFKEALTIYTDDKFELLEAVRKSSQRPTATDLAKGDIAGAVNESEAAKPVLPEKQQQQKRAMLLKHSRRIAAARHPHRQGPSIGLGRVLVFGRDVLRGLGHLRDQRLKIFQAAGRDDDGGKAIPILLNNANEPATRIFFQRQREFLAFDQNILAEQSRFLDRGP
jgi:hypothetical protein